MTVPGNLSSPLLATAAEAAAAAHTLEKSVRFNSSDSANLSRAFSSTGNQKTATLSFWLKRCKLGVNQYVYDSSSTNTTINLDGNDNLVGNMRGTGSTNYTFITNAELRDSSAWYHIVVAWDTSQATSSNRLNVYINGVEQTFSSVSYPPQNTLLFTNDTRVLGNLSGASIYLDAMMADIYFIDGSQLDATSFGAFDSNGVWQVAEYTGTFGSNGFHLLDFANESTVGHDSSGNNNDFTANNISTSGTGTDVFFDVPTNGTQSDTGAGGEVSGNYAVFNPLSNGLGCTVAEGNLQLSGSATSSARINGTIGVSSGKWYFEVTYTATDNYTLAGVGQDDITNQYPGQDAKSYAFDFHQGKKYNNGSQTTHGSSLSAGDIFMCALDLDNNKIFFGKNGTFFGSGNPATGANPSYTITAGTYHIVGRLNPSGFSSGNAIIDLNAGQRAYAHSAPTGFKSWNTTNLPTPDIADGSDYFDTKLYDGNGSTNAITGFEFSPDFVWLKRRSGAKDHSLFDTVRGVYLQLFTNNTDAEASKDTSLTSFDSNGFTLGSSNRQNENGYTNVAWAWDAGSSTVSNTDGTITSSVRANQTAGFSIVSYTGNGTDGATIGHGLSAAPEMVWYKNRDRTENWGIYSKVVGASKSLYSPSATSALTANSGSANMYNSTDPSATVLTVGQAAHVNANGEDIIAYCFAPVAGHSQISSWEGNGSTDGPFVYTGFRPAFILYKASDAAEHWHIRDTARDPHNVTQNRLLPSRNIAESGDADFNIDILSNGFKLRASNATQNQSGKTYLYYAVAENPFQANGGLAR